MYGKIQRQVADELARRTARRLEILRSEQPELLAERLASMDPEVLADLLELTRLPPPLADREPRRRHVGVEGVDFCTNRIVVRTRGTGFAPDSDGALSTLDDDDLLSAGRYVSETLPGNMLG
jgi:hypothetical protein